MTDETPGAGLPFTDEDRTYWRSEISRARKDRDDRIERWGVEDNLERYAPSSAQPSQINTGKDFSDVERKKAALFYDTPQVILTADPGVDPGAVQLHQEYLNTLLGPQYLDAKATALRAIQGCLVAIQPAPVEIGYTNTVVDAPGEVDPMTGMPAPAQPVVVHEAFYIKAVSEKATLLPCDFRSTRYDEAPWVGYDWRLPLSQVKREYGLPEDWRGGSDGKDLPFFRQKDEPRAEGDEPMVSGVTIWYKASVRDEQVVHPEVQRILVLADGQDEPLKHADAPYQDFQTDGRLTPNSVTGYPLHPLVIRDGIDTAWVQADLTVTASLTREIHKFREQVVQRRDASRNHLLYDADAFNPEVRQKFETNTIPELIPVEAGKLAGGMQTILAQVPPITLGRESYDGQNIMERDREGILGIGSNQVGQMTATRRTATEVSTTQRNTDARFEQERQRVLEWWLKGVQKLSAFVLRYGDRLATDVLGPQRGQAWVQARDQGVFGRFNFDIVIDSGRYVDIEARKRQDLQIYNLMRRDPALNPAPLVRRLGEDFGLDLSELLQPPPPPEPKPEPPKVSLSVSAQDLQPMAPWYPALYTMLSAAGVQNLPPPAMTGPPPVAGPPPPPTPPGGGPHGGPVPAADRIEQHQLEETGNQSGPPVPGGMP